MLILILRTDKPEAEIGLYQAGKPLSRQIWRAHRELAETIHLKLRDMLTGQSLKLEQIDGIVVYQGPGSFTGLRIGISVANALASSLKKPIVTTTGENWIGQGARLLESGNDAKIAVPYYGAEANTTQQRK